ncbi:MAG: cobyrinate a,c-diamide synthase [Candidatus Electryoneaceae bacterium]|nr:cobyrinate a,c-diamide synthase [Candidatus Electryoneaceae bacterium]
MNTLEPDHYHPARLMIAGIGGDSGKTLATLGLITAWRRKGITIVPFKKGPDYIDPAWLSLASGVETHNLDTWMMGQTETVHAFTKYATDSGINVIEANRGLYDGEDAVGSHSSAVLAKLLGVPVVVVIPVTKVTRTVAAIVLGLKNLDPDVPIAGVILNRVGTDRQEKVIRRAIDDSTGLPVLGAMPRWRGGNLLPGRHLGLVTPDEHQQAEQAVNVVANIVTDSVDIDRLQNIACNVGSLPSIVKTNQTKIDTPDGAGLRIGYFTGSAFTFYYPENLEVLKATGAELLPVNPLDDDGLPDVDVLYIGGGFPETHAVYLSENESFRRAVAVATDNGLPVWAECGGLMFLSRRIIVQSQVYPMAGVLPVDVVMHKRPQGHGYQEVTVDRNNPFIPVGTVMRGHEFHYSQVTTDGDVETIFNIGRGSGIGGGRDGITIKNVLACYMHIHSSAVPMWCEWMITAGRNFAAKNYK